MKTLIPNSQGVLYSAAGRACAITASMKLIVLILLVATSAVAQSTQTKSQQNMSKAAARAAGKPAPFATEAEARAAASTNLQARCAMDFRWRDITNRIGLQQKQVDKARADHDTARQRARLASQANQASNPATVNNAAKLLRDHESSLAALKLQQHDIEAANQKLLSVPR